jgi:GntR family transcriptional repressor for pyruvate dehydrogenase complex
LSSKADFPHLRIVDQNSTGIADVLAPPRDGLLLTPGRRQRLGDQLYGQILGQIVSGRLREGDRLPAEKDICAMFGVSRPVVRQALMRLRADGLVQGRQGAGSFVMSRPAEQLTHLAGADEVAAVLRCIEVRLPLEGAAARLAAQRHTPAQLSRLGAAHTDFVRQVEDGRMTPEADFAFHAAVAAASGNDLFPTLLATIEGALTGFMRLSLGLTRSGTKERARQVLSEHTHVLEAIRAGDGDAAAIAMQFHINAARRRMVDRNRDR